MKLIIATFFFLGIVTSNAQNNWDTEEREYHSGVYIQGLIDVNSNKAVAMEPKGKRVKIVYDPFYNSYQIDWEEQGGTYRMKLIAIRETTSAGTIFIDDYAPKEVQKEFFIHNYLEDEGKLVMIMADSFTNNGNEFKGVMICDDLQRTK